MTKEKTRRYKAVMEILKRGQKCANNTLSFAWKTDENHQYFSDSISAVIFKEDFILEGVPEIAVQPNTPNIQNLLDKNKEVPITDFVIAKVREIKAMLLNRAYKSGYSFTKKVAKITYKDIKTNTNMSIAFDPDLFLNIMEAITDSDDNTIAIEIRNRNGTMILENLATESKAFGLVCPFKQQSNDNDDEVHPPYFYTKACTYTEEEKMKFYEKYLDIKVKEFWEVAKTNYASALTHMGKARFDKATIFTNRLKKAFKENTLNLYHCDTETKEIIKSCEDMEKGIDEFSAKVSLPKLGILIKEREEAKQAPKEETKQVEEPKKEEKILLLPPPKDEPEEAKKEPTKEIDNLEAIKKAILAFDYSVLA